MSIEPVLERLARALPRPRSELRHDDAWQLLVATILSARSTDRIVNRITPALFARWPTPADLARAPQEQVEEVIRASGFYRNKARALREAARAVVERFGGEVPRTMDELVTLPGVARKTANVVLGTVWGVAEGITVDVHAARVARRLGLTAEERPERIERDLCAAVPRSEWVDFGHRLVLHGRYVCTARRPDCPACPLNEVCPSAEAPPAGTVDERARAERRRVEEGIALSQSAPDGSDPATA